MPRSYGSGDAQPNVGSWLSAHWLSAAALVFAANVRCFVDGREASENA